MARQASSVAPSVSAAASRSVACSAGAAPVIAGATHAITAAAATARGRKINQTTSAAPRARRGRKSTRLNTSHQQTPYGDFFFKKKKYSREDLPSVVWVVIHAGLSLTIGFSYFIV